MRQLRICVLGALILGSAVMLGGCVVAPRRPPPPPPPPACWWVPGHYNANGYWVPAHCKP
jgi:hypothetical protein